MLTISFPSYKSLASLLLCLTFCMTACKQVDSSNTASSIVETGGTPPVESVNASQKPGRQTLTVYAAASLTDVFQEISKRFEEEHAGVEVVGSYAGTQILRTQLEQGAYADVIAAADLNNMDNLVSEGIVDQRSIHVFAKNHLVVVLPPGNPAGVQVLKDLEKSGLKLILADESVPAGNYTRRVLSSLNSAPEYGVDFSDLVLANVVSNETDVRQVLTKVELGEGEAGIVYASDAISAPELMTIEIPSEFNIQAEYPIGMVSSTRYPDLAAEFINYVLSSSGQSILIKWGFSPGK